MQSRVSRITLETKSQANILPSGKRNRSGADKLTRLSKADEARTKFREEAKSLKTFSGFDSKLALVNMAPRCSKSHPREEVDFSFKANVSMDIVGESGTQVLVQSKVHRHLKRNRPHCR